MDHQVAVHGQTAARYVLGELSAAERDEFEEHVFDCPVCAQELRDTYAFAANLKLALSEDVLAASGAVPPASVWERVQGWLRGPSAFPVCIAAVLAMIVVYDRLPRPVTPPAGVAEVTAIPRLSRGAPVLVRTLPGTVEHHLLLDPPDESPTLHASIVAIGPDGAVVGSPSGIGVLENKDPATQISLRLPVKSYPGGHYRVYLRGNRVAEYDFEIVPARR